MELYCVAPVLSGMLVPIGPTSVQSNIWILVRCFIEIREQQIVTVSILSDIHIRRRAQIVGWACWQTSRNSSALTLGNLAAFDMAVVIT